MEDRKSILINRDDFDLIIEAESEKCEVISRETCNVNLLKSFVIIVLIIKTEAGDFYRLEYSIDEQGVMEEFPLTATQVFSHQITTTIYI
jgi:hypothetical protein